MTRIDRYVARSFLSTFFALLAIGIGMIVLLDLLANQDEFTKDPNASAGETLSFMYNYYIYNVPLYFSQLAGPLLSVSAAFTLGLMLRNNELTPLAAAGVPLQRLARPLLICAVLIVGVWIANREMLMPAVATKIARDHDDYLGRRTQGVHCVRDARNSILTAAELFPRQGKLDRVVFIEPDAHGRPANVVQADSATFAPTPEEPSRWLLENGVRISISDNPADRELNEDIRREPASTYRFGLTPRELLLRQSAQFAELMSFDQMNRLVQSQNLPNRDSIRRSRDVRFTQPLLQLVMLLLVIPFFLQRAPTNVLVAAAGALLLGGGFFLVTFLAGSFTGEGFISQAAVALPLVIFAPIAVLRLMNAKT